MSIPSDKNYKMPAEWHPHAATQMHWPSNPETWPGKRLERAEQVYLNIIEVLHSYEPIHLFVENQRIKEHVLSLFDKRKIDLQQLTFHLQPINDVWARDCGPIFIRKESEGLEQFAITDWVYNAWGRKYPPFDDDNRLPEYLASKYGIERFEPGMILEGGSVETNGNGILLTTESVLLNSNRNPDLTQQEIEQKLKDYLGINKIIWLKKGLAGDDTDGHIDDLSRFLSEDTILTMVSEDSDDVNYEVLRTNYEILRKATNQHGKFFTIETLTLPKTKIEGTTADGSEFVPASYANFYVANGVVLVPIYGERCDQEAMDLLEHYFPDRDIVGIPCSDLVWGQGAIHCITQQLYGI